MSGKTVDDAARVGLLQEAVRRSLYEVIVRERRWTSKEEAARAAGVSRSLATYHLDKLESAGLLETLHRRPPGKSGPGAGRPTKLYRRSGQAIDVTLPPRRYELAAGILLRGLAESGAPLEPIERIARQAGAELGAQGLDAALAECGFEPARIGGETVLCNCPFASLAAEERELTCRLNHALVSGLLDGAARSDLRADLEPSEEWCCVRLRGTGRSTD